MSWMDGDAVGGEVDVELVGATVLCSTRPGACLFAAGCWRVWMQVMSGLCSASRATPLFPVPACSKFLVDRSGNVVKRYGSTTSPMQIEGDIKALL